jgi:hypothetical protein
MFSWFLNPWMLLGGLAVASPILIHLLNKRRFKIVQWAAMDFLLQADKKNRRRVELENFILLLLRCLAMLLLALLLARPFLPSKMVSLTRQADKYERVVLLDDSLSQRVVHNQLPAFENIKNDLNQWLTHLANSDVAENRLTLLLTSRPDQPVLANEPVTLSTLANLSDAVNRLQTSDGVADYSLALAEAQRYLRSQRDRSGQLFYLFSDLRERDWLEGGRTGGGAELGTELAPNRLLNEIADSVLGCFLLDVGNPLDANLAITGIRPDGLLIADRLIRFYVTVTNFGDQPADQLRILFQVDEGQPQFESIAQIGPNQTQEISFIHFFPAPLEDRGLAFADEKVTQRIDSYRVRAEIDRSALPADTLTQDQLLEDSGGLFAATVARKISVLLVDGDPSTARERSETHYLRSLAVPGTGLEMKVVTSSEFETIPLSQFQVIFLCNLDEVTTERVNQLTHWVDNGGGLVLMPGNRVRASTFNQTFYRQERQGLEGLADSGLIPLPLTNIGGSPEMNQWVNFDVDSQIHPALRVVVESDVTSLGNVDIFSWWNTGKPEFTEETRATPGAGLASRVSVPLRLTDQTNSPAMIDRSLGQGRVILFTIPADGDWTMWPASPTYAPVMIDLIDYLVGGQQSRFNTRVGNSISFPVELSVYQNRVGLRDPNNEKIESVARPIQRSFAGGGPESDSNPIDSDPGAEGEAQPGAANEQGDGQFEPAGDPGGEFFGVFFDDLRQRGFYSLELNRHDGETESLLFAVNYDPRESQLRRLASGTLENNFFSNRVQRWNSSQLITEQVAAGNTEIGTQLLLLLFGILVTEQMLGWWWGRKR